MTIFYLAIPSHNLDASAEFYVSVFGAEPARRYHDRQTFNFFGHQVVCHLQPASEIERIYCSCRDRQVEHLSSLT